VSGTRRLLSTSTSSSSTKHCESLRASACLRPRRSTGVVVPRNCVRSRHSITASTRRQACSCASTT
jgi:hypothetical protein